MRALLVGVLAALGLAVPAPAQASATCHGVRVTILGTSGDDRLRGTPGRDVISGLGGDDRLRGVAGDDVLCGGRGSDVLEGGRGDDRLYGDLDRVESGPGYHRGDVLVGGRQDDLLDAGYDPRVERFPGSGDTVSWADSRIKPVLVDLEAGVARGVGRDLVLLRHGQVFLTAYDDTFRGTPGPDEVHGLAGRDRLWTRGGDDTVWTDDDEDRSDDRVVTGAGADDVWSLAGTDPIRLGPGRDAAHVVGFPDAVEVHAGRGADLVEALVPPAAGQVLSAGPDDGSRDLLRIEVAEGDHAVDLATGELLLGPEEVVVSVPGFQRAELYGGRFTVRGTAGDDRVLVNLASSFEGLGGDDEFGGSEGDDTFDGGDGTDSYLADPGGTNTCLSVEVDPNSACS